MKSLATIAALMLVSAVASAGYLQPAPVTVDLNPDGSGFAGGDMVSARFSDNDVELIGCGTRAYETGGPELFRWGFCNARDADGVQFMCTTERADLLDMMRATADYSYIQYAWNADGECTHIGFSTQSFYMPDFRDQGNNPGAGAPGRGR